MTSRQSARGLLGPHLGDEPLVEYDGALPGDVSGEEVEDQVEQEHEVRAPVEHPEPVHAPACVEAQRGAVGQHEGVVEQHKDDERVPELPLRAVGVDDREA